MSVFLRPPWTAARQASLSFTVSQTLLKLIYTELVMPSNHPILSPLLLLPPTFPSIKFFSDESAQVAKVLELQLQHQSFLNYGATDFGTQSDFTKRIIQKFLWSLHLKRTARVFKLLKSKSINILMGTIKRLSLLGIPFTANRRFN